jgi:hypothetical protein
LRLDLDPLDPIQRDVLPDTVLASVIFGDSRVAICWGFTGAPSGCASGERLSRIIRAHYNRRHRTAGKFREFRNSGDTTLNAGEYLATGTPSVSSGTPSASAVRVPAANSMVDELG